MPTKRKKTGNYRKRQNKIYAKKKAWRTNRDRLAEGEGIAMDRMQQIQQLSPQLLVDWGFDESVAYRLFLTGFISDSQIKFTDSDHHRVGKHQTRTNAKKHRHVLDKRDMVDKIIIQDKDLHGSSKIAKQLRKDGFKYDPESHVWIAYGDERDFGTFFKDLPHECLKAANPNIQWMDIVGPDGKETRIPYYKAFIPRRAVNLKNTVEGLNGEAVTIPFMDLNAGSSNTMSEKTGDPLQSKRQPSSSMFSVLEPGTDLLYFGEKDQSGNMIEVGEPIQRLIKCNLSRDVGMEFRLPLMGFRWKTPFVHKGHTFSFPGWFVASRDFNDSLLAKVSPDIVKRLPRITTD